MKKTHTISISEGQNCKVRTDSTGLTIEGPAVIVILEKTVELNAENRNNSTV